MWAWRLRHCEKQRKLAWEEMAAPVAGRGEVVVRVHGAGVTPTEMHWYPTTHTKEGGDREGAVPGHEFAGVVEVVGEGVTGVERGEEVFGMNDWFAEGATAELCVTRPEWIAQMPKGLTFAMAAAVPIGALTAWQGLERAQLKKGETVLVHGGSGAVGVFVVQLARRMGARVATTASERNRAFLQELGAERVIDYRRETFEEVIRGVDVVFDGVGGETLTRSWGVLGKGGRLVTIAADSEGTADERTKAAFFIVEPKREQLVEVGALLAAGELRAVVDREIPLRDANRAYEGKEERGRGKVVVVN